MRTGNELRWNVADGITKLMTWSRKASHLTSCRRSTSASLVVFLGTACFCTLSGSTALAQERSDFPVNDHHIVYHDVKTDAAGGIVPWYGSGPSEAYDHDIRLLWSFWSGMRKCPNGVPYYLLHDVWKEKEDDPRGLGGDQINMALDSWHLLYGYLGDPAIQQNMTMMADYWLEHGMSKSDLLWANLPYPYDLDVQSGKYDGDMRAGKGYLQPDKAGSFGIQLVDLYKMTGQTKYLDAAVGIADTLAARVIPGDAEHSPWPFRVNASTGLVAIDVRDGKTFTAAYTTNWTPTLKLFHQLQTLHRGNQKAYSKASELVTTWLKSYPLKTNSWGPFFEDIPTADYSDTEINADTMAAYLLEHPEWGPDSALQAKGILRWSYNTLGNHNFKALQVVPINEQTRYLVPGNSHTSRHAWVELLYCETTKDCSGKEQAIRRLNWATYSVGEDGKNRYPNDDIWLTDGYGDYIRHYLRAMASSPELAPEGQNHLLRTTSVIQHISYEPDQITYTKFDAKSRERLKLGDGVPRSVQGGKMEWGRKQKLLTIIATGKTVSITLDPQPSK
jgi:hypothetical protein